MEIQELKLYNTVSVGNDEKLYFHKNTHDIQFEGGIFRIECKSPHNSTEKRYKVVYTPMHNCVWYRPTYTQRPVEVAKPKVNKGPSKKSPSRNKTPARLEGQQTPIL